MTNTNKLMEGSGPWGGFNYYYDAAGNRTWRTLSVGGTTTERRYWHVNGSNKLASVDLDGTPLRSFSHDSSGNMLTDVKSSITTSYSYNHAGRLSNVTVGGVQKGGYIYNAVGQLVSRTVSNTTPSGTVHYVHDLNGNVIAETDGSGSTVREYVWIEHRDSGNGQATGAATPLAIVADVDTATPETYFVHPDHLDRPAMMTDASAGIVWNTAFLPFGSVHQITGTAANDNRFPGQWYQLESGLHYNWHRHYDPDLGRYTQPDPLGLVDGPIRYNYVNDDPLQAVDPEGLARYGPINRSFNPFRIGPDGVAIGGGGGGRYLPAPKRLPLTPLSAKEFIKHCRKDGNQYVFPGGGGYNEAVRQFQRLIVPGTKNPIQNSRFKGFHGLDSYGNSVSVRTGSTKGPGNKTLGSGNPGRPTIQLGKNKVRF